jgi:glycosyltransferase involved in cell wall biosynthesis
VRCAICIPTYRRAPQLARLIADLKEQTLAPDLLVVVDGDPASGEVIQALRSAAVPDATEVVYLPSNYASLPYQRYLGWKTCIGSRWLVYLDDDLRIPQRDFIEKMTAPLEWRSRQIAGVTCGINFGDPDNAGSVQASTLELTRAGPLLWHRSMNQGHLALGGLSPSGHRCMPEDGGSGYETVEWLSGAAMAFRTDDLEASWFPPEGFALFRARLATGEDLVLARHARQKGELLFAFCASVHHPYETPSNFGSADFYRLGLIHSYGERYVNDSYRGSATPTFLDRLALARSLAGSVVLHWSRFLRQPESRRWRFGCGFTTGALRALFAFPTQSELAPGVDWERAAQDALQGRVMLRQHAPVA